MDKIADEIVLRIFCLLDIQDIINCRIVSKRFSRITEDSFIYKSFIVTRRSCLSSSCYTNYIRKHHHKIKRLVLQDCFWIPSHKLTKTLVRCKELVELDITGCKLNSPGLLKIIACNPNLVKLAWTLPMQVFPDESYIEKFQTAFKCLSSLILHFKTIPNFEMFLPVFKGKELFINEFGLSYLKSSSSNTYGIYIKTQDKFQLCLEDINDLNRNRFLHFNLQIMDFIIQTVSKAAESTQIISLLARGNIVCWRHITPVLSTYQFEEIDLSLSVLAKDQMAWLSKLKKLIYLNLSHVGQFKSNLMRAIASNCLNLQVLNLSCCEDWLSKDLHGLEAVAKHCIMLREINLSNLHIHSSNKDLNKLCAILGTMKSLIGLSLPACCLVNNIVANQTDNISSSNQTSSSSSNSPIWKVESFKPSSLLVSLDSSNFVSSSSIKMTPPSSSPATRLSRMINNDQTLVSAIGSGLNPIVKGCVGLEELEIIDTGFHSPFNRVVFEQFICPLTSHLRDRNFKEIVNLKNLKRLVLAGLPGVGAFNSLPEITMGCVHLETLSLAHCGLAGHSNSLMHLKNALRHCKNLKHFRLDQPHFIIKEDLLESFHQCKHLQTICFINKNGKGPKAIEPYAKLFDNCKYLVVFFLFSGMFHTDCSHIQNVLTKRYHRSRPPLCVLIHPFNTALKENSMSSVPYPYLRDLVHFESTIAVCEVKKSKL